MKTFLIGIIIVIIIAFYGWVLNILAIVHSGGIDDSGLIIVRAIGVIIVPLGSVLGFIYN